MKELSEEKKQLFKEALKSWYKDINKGYIRLTKDRIINGVKIRSHLKHSRVIVQLTLDKELEPWEHVHHKDGNKQNDSLENLEVLSDSEHNSLTHAGKRRKNKPSDRTNKLSQEKINQILKLSKTIKNYSEIARMVGVSSFTVANYIKGLKT